ncbi:hypothetical protein BSZ37_07945 [Rubrivirga marina]|uniref:Uncharacterized protein n=2 Tax=Rubrivirga marina TaxID=1196024 RepID=A0A271J0X3_9BACT|nr:hypothetical protein BSZ37_07945 [Rubrivirga marina]
MLGLVVLYGLVLRPARPLLTHGLALPAFHAAAVERPGAFDVVVRRSGLSVEIYRAGDDADRAFASWTAPPGLLFLLPGLFLVGLRPRRPYWAVLLACHVALGGAQVALVAAGIAWSDAVFEAYRFSQTYATEAVGLGVPVLLYVLATRDGLREDSGEGSIGT